MLLVVLERGRARSGWRLQDLRADGSFTYLSHAHGSFLRNPIHVVVQLSCSDFHVRPAVYSFVHFRLV